MKVDSGILDNTQKNMLALVNLFARYGYAQYKMSKFEAYDLYSKNKGFLVNDSVITFTDTNGKLMALKPDVTLSIVKNADKALKGVEKLYYNESVYRVSKHTASFKEIMQVGVECFGEVDDYHISEVLLLAAKSLQVFCDSFILEVSHIGIISALIHRITADEQLFKSIWRCVNETSIHSVFELCRQNGIEERLAKPLETLLALSGTPRDVLPQLEALTKDCLPAGELAALKSALSIFEGTAFENRVILDFSAVGNIHYYNGIIFNGFVEGIPESVLSGGQYDALMRKMKKDGRAIGFAVYFDLLERLDKETAAFDADVLLLYDDACRVSEISAAVSDFQKEGKSVFAAGKSDNKIKAKEVYRLQKGRVMLIENNA